MSHSDLWILGNPAITVARVDNDNVVRGLEKRLGIERADAVWAVAENCMVS